MDSTLIIDYAEALALDRHAAPRSLMPRAIAERQRTLQLTGLASRLRKERADHLRAQPAPAEKQHAPWVARVRGQLAAAFTELEAALARQPLACTSAGIDQAGVSCAVTWFFVRDCCRSWRMARTTRLASALRTGRTPARVQPGAARRRDRRELTVG